MCFWETAELASSSPEVVSVRAEAVAVDEAEEDEDEGVALHTGDSLPEGRGGAPWRRNRTLPPKMADGSLAGSSGADRGAGVRLTFFL